MDIMPIIGVCGHYKTGSSTVINLLKEFDNINVLLGDHEFVITYFPDGVEDLEYHLRYFRKNHSAVAIKRFRKFIHNPFNKALKGKINTAVDRYLNEIIHNASYKICGVIDYYFKSKPEIVIRKFFARLFRMLHIFRFPFVLRLINRGILCSKIETSITPECLDTASKSFISDVLDVIGYDRSKVTVLNQPFNSRTPLDSFKYFDNPKAVLVDRDPRDHYILLKKILRFLGREGTTPINSVEDYISYFKRSRSTIQDLKKYDNIMIMNYEELVHDYDNAVRRLSSFCGISSHINKGKYFNPSQARENTQLFKKYTDCENDIKKIESELSEYLFPFETYLKPNQ